MRLSMTKLLRVAVMQACIRFYNMIDPCIYLSVLQSGEPFVGFKPPVLMKDHIASFWSEPMGDERTAQSASSCAQCS